MIDFRLALEQLLQLADRTRQCLRIESIPTTSAIHALKGRILAQPARATIDYPQQPKSRMDGYALADANIPASRLRIVDARERGTNANRLASGYALPIATGETVPEGGKRVIPKEAVTTGPDWIEIMDLDHTETWIRPAGEDFRSGDELLPAGIRLDARKLALVGAAQIPVLKLYARAKVAVIRLGDELIPVSSQPPANSQYDLNALFLQDELQRLPLDYMDYGILEDDLDRICDTLQQAAHQCDLIITTGGTSAGNKDWIVPAIRKLGQLLLHRISIRPGMPFAAGVIEDTPVLALPGNPLSVSVGLQMLIKPFVYRMCGRQHYKPQSFPAYCTQSVNNPTKRLHFMQAHFEAVDVDGQKQLQVTPLMPQHSALLTPLAQANCLLEVPAQTHYAPFERVAIWLSSA